MEYELCLELARKLEIFKNRGLQDSPAVKNMADLMYRFGILDLEYLNKVAESLLAAGITEKEEPAIELTPESLLRNDLLSEDLKPWVEKLRKRLFGKVEAPFQSYDNAAQWIIKNEAPLSPWKKGSSIRVGRARRNVRVYDDCSEHAIVMARIGSPLEKIIFACQKLVTRLEIGLEWNSLVFYVLANIPPFIPPIEMGVRSYFVRLPSGRELEYREATVTIREGFNRTCLSWMYDELRYSLQLTKKKSLSSSHLELYRLVQKNGGAPKGKGSVVFWSSIMNDWNKFPKRNKYKTWKGVKICYERVISKLRPDHIGWLQKEEAQNERSHSQKE
jgi:hypothetical protein